MHDDAAIRRGKESLVSTDSEELGHKSPEHSDPRRVKAKAPTLAKPALAAAKTVIQCLRWALLLVLLYTILGEVIFVYTTTRQGVTVHPPAWLDAFVNPLFMFLHHAAGPFVFVAVGAKIAPRYRRTTALVFAGLQISLSLWSHVLFGGTGRNVLFVIADMLAEPWLIINYRHFFFEALGAVLGVVYIFCSEKCRGTKAS